jgi:hypothetical protein
VAHRARRSKKVVAGTPWWAWGLALAVALAGGVAYLLWPSTLLWWLAPFAALPFLWLARTRAERTGSHRRESEHFDSHGAGGPWSSP